MYSYRDPLWTHSYTFIHIWTFYGPIHISVFIYGPIKDPFIYVYSYMDPSWTHYGPIYGPIWTHSYTCIHIWTHCGPIHIRVSEADLAESRRLYAVQLTLQSQGGPPCGCWDPRESRVCTRSRPGSKATRDEAARLGKHIHITVFIYI